MNKEIIECIKIFNMGSTIKIRDRKNANYNSELNINYDENINIGDILTIFINEYLNFKEEYDKLPKLTGYNELTFISYGEYEKIKSISLDFYDNNKIMKSRNGYLILSLEEENGKYSSHIFNDFLGTEFKEIDANIDSQIVKQYLDLFKKYKKLIDAYNYFSKKTIIFGNGYSSLFVDIQGEILDNLNSFKITFGNDILNKEMWIELNVEISNKSKFIDKKIKVLKEEIKPASENIEYILKNTYLNKEYLPDIYKENKTSILQDSQKIKHI